MAVEIEAKLKVDDLTPVRARLHGLKAEFRACLDQQDLYFDNDQGYLMAQDKCLRIRVEVESRDQGTKTLLTYKGPKQPSDVKCRQEIEIPVSDEEQARTLLDGLGYAQKMIVHKHRELWSFKQCLIGLDQVTDLGTFVEIEGPDSAVIGEVQKDLKLGHIRHCHKSYACLLSLKSRVQSPESSEGSSSTDI
jgi:adenylate cyclase class 2